MCDKTCPHMGLWSPSPHQVQNQGLPLLGDDVIDVATTTATIFAFPNAAGRGQPFLQLYLPFCMGEEPVSSVYCRPGALIVSCLRTGNDRRDAIGPYQWHFNGCKHCFIKNQQKALNAQEDRGGEGRGNATIKRRLEGTWTGGGDR